MKSVYIETSIPSYLAARPSRDIRVAAWQEITVQWWESARNRYDLYTSEIVVADTKPLIRSICALAGYSCPEICTPQELLPEENSHAS